MLVHGQHRPSLNMNPNTLKIYWSGCLPRRPAYLLPTYGPEYRKFQNLNKEEKKSTTTRGSKTRRRGRRARRRKKKKEIK